MNATATPERQLTPDELIQNNMGLVGSLAYRISQTTGVEYLELFQEGSIGLIKAARSFNPEKGYKFSTYANRCIQNDMLGYLRKSQRISRRYLSLDALPDWWNLVGLWEPDMSYMEIDLAILERMPTKQKQLIMLLFRGLSQREAAEEMGYTPSYISRILSKTRTYYENNSKLNLI
jgi:RNA polymerase sporulation-specific sigma factor